MAGSLIISLDFELHWGGAEVWNLEEKSEYFLNTRTVILEMLQLFQEYNIRVTWATVGFLFASSREEVMSFSPPKEPSYLNQNLNYFNLFRNNVVGPDEGTDPFHFGYSLIQEIIKTPGQELASHTFSHYYCNEEGQTKEEFDLDLQATQKIAKSKFTKKLTSLVFPRNQYNTSYLELLKDNEYNVIRTNPDVWFWKMNNKFIPLARALDTLLPISNKLSFKNSDIKEEQDVVLLPASRFFRPYSQKEKSIQKLKMNRIKKEMLVAAKKGENYHLWWHPHNFGSFPQQNMIQLREILEYYKILNKQYGFSSKNMGDFQR
ncbi:polysaccharide deacetylase family protein [Kaistella antarctica]|uniref:Polysaccharide deacetylase family sporulation protein PdaB n=1 Tax=Kaistella antarctica TaxID=266748 RepID=A0A3S4VF07_9FLAO|nr:polysaccharide deacetylase family protein [Kaistella antarctica]KEY18788.1 hypothetical protein HY04_09960 [Kaistella antarctica]SEW15409.1 Polysaccharide deacetylase [Kaistella antarctica]VEH99505.1 polysaccharide deacetylase family sporulation protein PdaB [Kaistella antarctica]